MLLAAQDLGSPPRRPATRDDVLDTIRRIGVLQIDSISVVARSPYLVLWSRIGADDPVWFDELLAEGGLFEYWSHAACFIPIDDYGLYRRLMLGKTDKTRAWMEAHPDALERVMGRIRQDGREGRRLVGVEARKAGARAPVRRRGTHDLAPRELSPRLRPARACAVERVTHLGRRPRAKRTGGTASSSPEIRACPRRRSRPLGLRLLPHAQEGCRRAARRAGRRRLTPSGHDRELERDGLRAPGQREDSRGDPIRQLAVFLHDPAFSLRPRGLGPRQGLGALWL